MTTKWMFLLIVGAVATLGATSHQAEAADLQPMIVRNLTGTLRVQQGIPCDDDVDLTRSVIGGHLELVPALGVDVSGGKRFVLTRSNVRFDSFSVSRSCLGFGETRNYSQIGVQLGRAVEFTALGSGGVYPFTIPKASFLIYQSVIVNGGLEIDYRNPTQDVTGTIDFNSRTVSMHVVIDTQLHFEAGCTIFGCIIDTTKAGRLTADIAGTMALPDTDGDGVADIDDNCKFTANPSQEPVATPVIEAPPDMTIASCLDHQIGGAKAADLCDALPVIVTNNAPPVFVLGPTVVTWTATDSKLRTDTDTQTVTVVDTTPPTFTSVPPDLFPINCGPVDLGLPTATDDCAGTVTFSNDSPGYFYVGPTVVTWTATDVSGNSSTATQTVTVTDLTPPIVTCTPSTPLGNSYIVSAIDACLGEPTIRLGSYVLAEGEQVKINVTGQPGVRFVNVASGIRHFQVGPGEAFIVGTDIANNSATAVCNPK